MIVTTVWVAQSARISEPPTVIYGRITERVGAFEFPITQGQLVWNLRTTGPGARDYQLTAQVERLGGGRFSYRLTLPHEVLAYDLNVDPKALGLGGTGARVLHQSVTLDGRLLTLAPGTIEGFALEPSRRAGRQRIDLYLSANSPDTDGDGLPDWWEDQNGLDKWDSGDAASVLIGVTDSGESDPRLSSSIRTFAEWRAEWFPNSGGDLERFGLLDDDDDGISNLLEYAFNLNPTQSDAQNAGALPYPINQGGRLGVVFRQRALATDLTYQIERSADLLEWTDASPELEAVANAFGSTSTATTWVERAELPSVACRFFRVRVGRQ
ncbi:MAG TPA: hypothetical protein DCE44_18745 [Verrucomicrobiales bacterium]|nr:hypothetical protein [Verrucomicrobiales bacterium]